MIVGDSFNQLGLSGSNPFFLKRELTAGAVAVVAGTCVDFRMTAFFAITDVVTKFPSLTATDTR